MDAKKAVVHRVMAAVNRVFGSFSKSKRRNLDAPANFTMCVRLEKICRRLQGNNVDLWGAL